MGKSYLEVDGVTGEVTDAGHVGTIEVLSFTIPSFSRPSSGHGGSGSGSGKVNINEMHLVIRYDRGAAELLKLLMNGKQAKKATLTALRDDGSVYLTVTMKDVLVSSFQFSDSDKDPRPTAQVGLNFGEVKMEYTPGVKDPKY